MTNKGELTKIKIVENSLQLFSVKGYYNTSINDILKATGLTKGGLYSHFQSKEDIWYAVYEKAVLIWRDLVFRNIKNINDPIERINRAIENDMKLYLGGDVFDGGCFFLNMLVELTGQSQSMSRHVLKGIKNFSRLISSWLKEADEKGLLKNNLNLDECANFIIISLNGAASLYSAIRDKSIWIQTIAQLNFYINRLKKE